MSIISVVELFIFLLFPSRLVNAQQQPFALNPLLKAELQIGQYQIDHTEHSPIISDENENFYLKTQRGFNKYNSNGELVFELILLNNYTQLSNLVYSNGSILFINKTKPGYLHIINAIESTVIAPVLRSLGEGGSISVENTQSSENCQTALIKTLETEFCLTSSENYKSIELINEEDFDKNTISSIFGFSNIGLDKSGNYLYFASHNPPRAFKYNLSLDKISFFNLYDGDNTYVLGAHVSAPVALEDSAVLFSTNKGYIQKFINENIAAKIFTEKYINEYALLNLRSDYTVPITVSKNHAYYLFDKYICRFGLSRGVNDLCEFYTFAESREGGPYITNISNFEDSVFVGFSKKYSSTVKTGLQMVGDNLNRVWDVGVYLLNRGGITGFKHGVLVTGEGFSAYDFEGNLLSTYEPTKPSDSGLLISSTFSPTVKNNYYVYYARLDNDGDKYHYIYKFEGPGAEKQECQLLYYCESIPLHRPVIFIHGLGGNYEQWFNGQRAKLRDAVLEDYRKTDPEFPDQWAHAYSYGINFNQNYDYQGKIEDISTNMHTVVSQLANESQLAGGDGKVDIVAYSLGGLVARHYILEKTGFPGEQNLNVDHKIGKLILIASPVNGSSYLQKINQLETNSLERKILTELLNKSINVVREEKVDIRDDIGKQLYFSSPYLKDVNNSYLPKDIEYFRSYVNLIFSLDYSLFGKTFSKSLEVGDGVIFPVDTDLASATLTGDFKLQKYAINLSVTGSGLAADFDYSSMVDLYHTNYPSHPYNISRVLNYLISDEVTN